MDDHANPTAARRAGGDQPHGTTGGADRYAVRWTSADVVRARELRSRADAYAGRGMVAFGRTRERRAVRPRKTMIASLAALTSLVAGSGAALAGQIVYQIQAGDTLSQLAVDHDSSVAELAELNDIPDPDLIIEGDSLLIPTNDGTNAYVIEAGDTIEAIAAAFGTSVNELIDLNGLSNPDLIVTGDTLLVPGPGDVTKAPPLVVDQGSEGDSEAGDDATPILVTDEEDGGHGSIDDSGDDGSTTDADQDTGDATPPTENTEEPSQGTDDGSTDETPPADETDQPSDDTGDSTGDTPTETPTETPPAITALHLVTQGETLESIAAFYGISVDELLAANQQAVGGIAPGMILAIPEGASSGVQLVGVPAIVADSADTTDAAALAAATAYWGGEIPQEATLEVLSTSDSVVDGLSTVLEQYGYHAGAFDSSAGAETLTAQIDAGFPVVLWLAGESGNHAVVVYGYDDKGVFILDVADGTTGPFSWDSFMATWEAAGGLAIAVAPL